MWFEGREIKPYAESVEKHELQVGSWYYTVSFYDEDLTVPELLAMKYVGPTTTAEIESRTFATVVDGEIYLFESASSVFGGVSRGPLTFFENELAGVYSFDAAIDVLLWCALNRGHRNDI